jgi:23S rRNA pseudouridine2605 synthase
MGESMRVQRALARAGIASRRKAEELIAARRVTVNGTVATIGQSVDPDTDTILVDGKRIRIAPLDTWIVLNKPPGFVTTRRDPRGRRTVFELVEDRPGLTYVGRLDYMTEGVLLFTTDGAAAHALTHPSRQVERTYVATVKGDATDAARAALRGVELEDGIARAVAASVRPGAERRRSELTLTLTEGRNQEVRRICAALGLEVERLLRTSFGPVRLGALPSGETRPLSRRESELVTAIVNQPPHGRHGTRQRGHQ